MSEEEGGQGGEVHSEDRREQILKLDVLGQTSTSIMTTAYKTMQSSMLQSSRLSVVAEGENEEYSSSLGSYNYSSQKGRIYVHDEAEIVDPIGVIVEATEESQYASQYAESSRKL